VDSPFANRLRKNFRHLKRWAERQQTNAFRVYDRDLPEYPFVVEWYDGEVHLVEFQRRRPAEDLEALRQEVLAGVLAVLEVPETRVHKKTHLPMPWGRAQYQREGNEGRLFPVTEHGLKLWVNLTDYLDTGLFLDHRATRARVGREASGKRFLNLFCYTGVFTVHAAAGGAKSTTSVDLSNTYLDWAEKNLSANGFTARLVEAVGDARGSSRSAGGPGTHTLLRSDVTRWIEQAQGGERFDLIVLDPPSFSASKKMVGSFNVQRDHVKLLEATLGLLAPTGTLYFSTNFRGFKLEADVLPARFEELTPRSLPEDIHQKDIHRCWRVTPSSLPLGATSGRTRDAL
jgi:23S rRNA (cytosine1962-C5)-methyltransferase